MKFVDPAVHQSVTTVRLGDEAEREFLCTNGTLGSGGNIYAMCQLNDRGVHTCHINTGYRSVLAS